jgi:hypothetical protein
VTTVTGVTAVIEALVGAACLTMAWGCWRRGTVLFRGAAVVLGVAGLVAITNAIVSPVR